MGLTIALTNLKPGTGKTTCSVWLGHALAEADHSVVLVDADPAGSTVQWNHLAGRGTFPFKVVPLANKDLHKQLDGYRTPADVTVIDAPQIENHAAIARSAILAADIVVVPVRPSPIEIARTAPIRAQVTGANPAAQTVILLNQCITGTNSIGDAREALTGLGYDVLDFTIPRLEAYTQSFGGAVQRGDPCFWAVARELLDRAKGITR